MTMTKTMIRVVLTSAALLGSPLAVSAAGMLTDAKGMTLYVFDKDAGGKSACYDSCATKGPPYLGKKGETMAKDWTMVERTDKTLQWAYDGKPLYFFAGDKAKGDMAGDGMGGLWHIVKE